MVGSFSPIRHPKPSNQDTRTPVDKLSRRTASSLEDIFYAATYGPKSGGLCDLRKSNQRHGGRSVTSENPQSLDAMTTISLRCPRPKKTISLPFLLSRLASSYVAPSILFPVPCRHKRRREREERISVWVYGTRVQSVFSNLTCLYKEDCSEEEEGESEQFSVELPVHNPMHR